MSQSESILGPYLQPGTRIKVGQYSTKIVRYLSEGGFSHVYIAKLDIPVKGSDVAVLKRIVAPDKTALSAIRTEVDTMKRLKGHRYIVTYIDSHASALKAGGFEVYVLMEYCPGGGLIDFMNTRLQTRLAEWEVLKIISDTAEAVACMHYLRPPLLHRDLKIENVLISGDGCYKLCDFGSCTEPRHAATNSQERRDLEDDIQKNTTIQYRSPEMVDVSRRLPIDEKSDIWALGVLLYKLCYFTTPFESQGQLAILNAAYTFPPYPPYTDRTKRLIAVTLQEHPKDRPNIYQLVAEICAMRNVAIPIKDIYSRSRSAISVVSSRTSQSPAKAVDNVLQYEAPVSAASRAKDRAETTSVPMRRGRPERSSSPQKLQVNAADSAIKAIVQTTADTRSTSGTPYNDVSEFATKFPSLEEMDFALGAGTGAFNFDTERVKPEAPAATPEVKATIGPRSIHSRVSNLETGQFPKASDSRPLPTPPQVRMEGASEERVLKPSEIGRDGNYVRHNVSTKNNGHVHISNVSSGKHSEESRSPYFPKRPVSQSWAVDNAASQTVLTYNRETNPYQSVSDVKSSQHYPLMGNQALIPNGERTTTASPSLEATSRPYERAREAQHDRIVQQPKQQTRQQSEFSNPHRESYPAIQSKPNITVTMENKERYDALIGRAKSANGNRQTIHVDSGSDFMKDLDTELASTNTHSKEITGSDVLVNPAEHERSSVPSITPIGGIRRSVSVNSTSGRHGKRPSLSSVPSFSGAARNLMSGKFGEAFKKFEVPSRGKVTSSHEISKPLETQEADLPDHVTQHMRSSEAKRSQSYTRSRPSLDQVRRDTPDSSDSERPSSGVKETLRKLQEKSTQAYVSQRSVQGYGKYTEPQEIQRAATVIPTSRPPTFDKPAMYKVGLGPNPSTSKNQRRYALTEDDEDFSKRYPSLSDFKV